MRSWWRWCRRWWRWEVSVMAGGRCHWRNKMMGRGPEGGCGTDERPCRPNSRVTASTEPKAEDSQPKMKEKEKPVSLGVDFFSQAYKALSERSPFDVLEEGPGPSAAGISLSLCTLPSGLASLLRQSDSRKRHKKSHSNAEKKASRPSERSKGRNIWVETEDYFRDLALPDIDALFEVSNFHRTLAGNKYFLIPCIGNKEKGLGANAENADNRYADENRVVVEGDTKLEEVEQNKERKQSMEIDGEAIQSDVAECLLLLEEKDSSLSGSSIGVEWLAGCKNRNILTSERPSKKRKHLATDVSLEKVLIGAPCEGNTLCDFCCRGGLLSDFNKLIVCSSCKVPVHHKCYGVKGVADVESWLCSWCKQKNDGGNLDEQTCVLCPKKGGALKPLSGENGGSVAEFAHLFCSLWMPEVYIEDLVNMEPILNVRGIRETRKRLLCNVCKVKCGACIRCSHGSCKATFHPICAREGRHRMEVWGKYGCNDVELRAFCLKHSEELDEGNIVQVGGPSVAIRSDSPFMNSNPVVLSVENKLHSINCGNGDRIAASGEASVSIADECNGMQSQEISFADTMSNSILELDRSDADQLICKGTSERSDFEDVNHSETLNSSMVLKKLIDRGKVNVKDVASEFGVSPDFLIGTLAENSLVADLQGKIFKWLRNHAYMVSDSDISNPVAVKLVPPRRRTRSNIAILRDEKLICSSRDLLSDSGIVMDEGKADQLISEELEMTSEAPVPSAINEKSMLPNHCPDLLSEPLSKLKGSSEIARDTTICETVELSHPANARLIIFDNADQGTSEVKPVPPLIKAEALTSNYVHPCICNKLMHIDHGLLTKSKAFWLEGLYEEVLRLEASSAASVCCNHQDDCPNCNDMVRDNNVPNSEQFVMAKKLKILQMSPADEVEGEILYFQHRLLNNAVARKHLTDNLICKVAKSLPLEIDAARSQRWDAVLANQHLFELREAKKQGRKERRQKEAQAVLAAATAAAAASSRNSSLRKDTVDDSAHQEKLNTYNGRVGSSSQLIPCPRETLSRVAVPRTSSEKYSDIFHSVLDSSKENPRSCDICRRSETMLNPILVCSSCKVAVHLDCYCSVKESTGPWHCQLCDELLTSKSSGTPSVNFWEKPYFVAECCLCGGTTGAFRKTSDGQWVHAFCAEWVFESTFRRGQVNPVDGMDTVSKGVDLCCICRRKHGVCIKCSYGHCQTTFHPSCARSAGLYMNVKILGGKYQHKAYCEKHSLDQRAKAETQKHGVEELKSMKQIRVELERLRLLCERIIKREKIKRDLVLCSHSILACKRDHVARSMLVHIPFCPPEVSSESATTSLKGNTDGYRSYNDAIQRSDDVTVDSAVSGKRQIKVTVSMDTEQKTDDSSTSLNLFTRKPVDRLPFGGKQIPQRPSPGSQNLVDDGEWSSSRKTFEKELIMTSDQASMKNRQLPKGYIYIPVNCLAKKQADQDVCSGEPLDQDG